MSLPFLILKGIGKSYDTRQRSLLAVEKLDLKVREGEFLCIVGESGCGKSTLLRLIGGLEEATKGEIYFRGQKVIAPSLDRGMVFQEPRLFPWMTVEGNIAFGCPESLPAVEKKRRAEIQIGLVGLDGFEKAHPHQLSGGMQQRAALARALVGQPKLLLLDEPFGALDALTRIRMQEEILTIRRAQNTTMVMVTHDIDEALFLGDRVAVMSRRPGTIKKIISLRLARPRDRGASGFQKARREIYKEFFGKNKTESSAKTPILQGRRKQ